MGKERSPEIPVPFYRTESGGTPVLDWLRGLEKGDRRAIGLDLMRVQFGWPIGSHLCEALKMAFGSALLASEPPDSPPHAVLSRPDSRRAARVHQENAENADR